MVYSLRILVAFSAMAVLIQCSHAQLSLLAQNFVEHPKHQRTYGDHTVNAHWDDGPAGIAVSFDSDDVTKHEDGVGFSQRTARNTQTFVSPSAKTNPQNYDAVDLVKRYGNRLPLLQQMSASGTSVLTYAFDLPVNSSLDLFITDVDYSDAVTFVAFDDQDAVMDMSQWQLIATGDLSTFKDTRNGFSAVTAPTPITVIESGKITLTATDDTNYNRSYSIFRSPTGRNLSRIEITFKGTQNSPKRDRANTGSHIYTALTTAVP